MSDAATMNAYAFHDATLPVEREPLSCLTRRCMLVDIVALYIAGGWALITMQTPKLIIGEVAPMGKCAWCRPSSRPRQPGRSCNPRKRWKRRWSIRPLQKRRRLMSS